VRDHLKANWRRYVLVAATAAAAYYGVPPGVTEDVLKGACSALGAC
jgi:hypothetical protein